MTTSRDRTWWRHLSGWRHRARALGVTAAGTLVLLVLTAAPAEAAGVGSAATAPFTDPYPGPALTVVRLLVITAGSLVAGAGLCRVLVPESAVSPAATRAVWSAAVVAAAAVVTAALLGRAALPLAAAQVVVTLGAAAALRRAALAVPAGAVLTLLLALELSAGSSGLVAVTESAFALVAALLGGSSLLAATGSFEAGRARTPLLRLGLVALGAAVLACAAGAVHAVVAGPHTTTDLLHTGFGQATLLAIALPLPAAAAWALALAPVRVSPLRVSSRGAGRVATVGVVTALGALSLLATVPPPAPAPVAGRPLLRPVDLAGHRMSLLVTPALPGRNLVRLSGPATAAMPAAPMPDMAMPDMAEQHAAPSALTISAGGPAVPVTARPGASGSWAVLDIPAGTRQLTVTHAGSSAVVPVEVGSRAGTAEQRAMQAALTGPNGPECADAVVGGLLADATAPLPTACPAQRLDPEDAGSLAVVVDTLADRGIRSLALAQDASPRSAAAAAVIGDEAARRGVAVSGAPTADGAVVVVSGWAGAADTLHDIARRAASAPTAAGGTYLAPWLLTGEVVTGASSSVLPLRFNPQETGPRQYAATLVSVFPDSVPSSGGYTAWARATHSAVDPRVTLYAAAPVNVPMGMDMDMDATPGQWFPGGSIVPISEPLSGS